MTDDYKNSIEIDIDNLENEWRQQPIKFMEWAHKAVEMESERDRLKDKLEVLHGKIDLEIRQDPEKFGIVKATESSIQSAMVGDIRIQGATSDYLQAVKDAKMFNVMREAFDHRKKALEKMTDLWIAGYYAEPRIKKEAKDAVEEDGARHQRENLERSAVRRRRS
jgi:hypothetical protein